MAKKPAKRGRFFEPLAVAVAGGCRIADAAEKIGCAESTAYKTTCTPEFRARVAEIRTAAVDQAVGALSELAKTAAVTLSGIMRDTEARDVDRIAAARAVLGSVSQLSELHELRSRVDQLERAQEEEAIAHLSDGGTGGAA